MSDLRYAIRSLWKNRGYSALIILTLAIGIGANTAIFSVVDKTLLNPLPFEDADRLVEIREHRGDRMLAGVSPPIYNELSGLTKVFQNLIAYQPGHLLDFSGEYPEYYWGAEVTPNFFKWLNVDATLGRVFLPEEGSRGNTDYIVLGHTFWEKRFNADPNVIGTSVSFARYLDQDPKPFTVIGVMPPEFKFPASRADGPDYWTPDDLTTRKFSAKRAWQMYADKNWTVAARLAPDVSQEQAQAALLTVATRHADKGRGMNKEMKIRQRSLSEAFAGDDFQKTLWGLTGAIAFVLLIACANIGNLQLARTEARQKELAIRTAMGANRGRLARQLLTENLLLAGIGGGLGVLAGWWGMTLLVKLMPAGLPRLNEVQLDARLLAFTLTLSLLCGLFFGLAPSWRPVRNRLSAALKEGEKTSDIGAGRQWTRQTLIVTQVALTIVLIAGAGLMVQSVERLLRVDPGYNPENLLSVNVHHFVKHKRGTRPMDREQYQVFLNAMHENLASIPGVTRVGSSKTEYGQFLSETDTRPRRASSYQIGTGKLDFFRAKGIQLLRGRNFEPADYAAGATSIIASEAMVREFWPDTDGLNQRLRSHDGKKTWSVIGVAPDLRDYSLDTEPSPAFYEPAQRAEMATSSQFVVRTGGDPESTVAAIRTRIWEADKSIPPVTVSVVMDGLIHSTKARRIYMWLLSGFAAVGLLLAMIGIYGSLACGVARRTHEFGVRMALGARASDVIRLVMSQGARVILIGVAAGLAAANWLTQYLASQLYGVTPTDPMVFATVTALVILAASAACFLPARKASRLHPMEALRDE